MNLQTLLVGVNFRPASAKSVVKFLKTDQALRLARDADNPYDINAIQVIDPDSEEFIGFIARADAATIAPIMDGGAEVTCKVLHNNGMKEVHLGVDWPDDAVALPATEIPSHTAPVSSDTDDEIPF